MALISKLQHYVCSLLTDRSTARKQTATKFVNSRYFNSTSPQTWPGQQTRQQTAISENYKTQPYAGGPYVLYYK